MDRRRTAVVLVGSSSVVSLLVAAYGLVNRTLEARALHAHHGWELPLTANLDLLVFVVWFYSIALLVPAAGIGASALLERARSGRVRATAFVALMCLLAIVVFAGAVTLLKPSAASGHARRERAARLHVRLPRRLPRVSHRNPVSSVEP